VICQYTLHRVCLYYALLQSDESDGCCQNYNKRMTRKLFILLKKHILLNVTQCQFHDAHPFEWVVKPYTTNQPILSGIYDVICLLQTIYQPSAVPTAMPTPRHTVVQSDRHWTMTVVITVLIALIKSNFISVISAVTAKY